MAELTREYLDKKLDKLATKNDIKHVESLIQEEVTSLAKNVDEKIDSLAKNVDEKIDSLAKNVDEKIDSLAMMVANSLEEIKSELDVKKEVESLNRRMFRIEQALDIKAKI